MSGFTLSTAFKSCSFLYLNDLQFRFSSLSSLGTSLVGFLPLGDFLLLGDAECAGGPGDAIDVKLAMLLLANATAVVLSAAAYAMSGKVAVF